MRAVQVSARGGDVEVLYHDDDGLIEIQAKGMQTMEGEILVPVLPLRAML